MTSGSDACYRKMRAIAIAAAFASMYGTAARAQAQEQKTEQTQPPAAAPVLPAVTVVGAAPLPGLGMLLSDVPSAVQVIHGRQIEAQHPGAMAGFLERNASGVTLNSTQGNPNQEDLYYRGFHASSLIGAPEGMSVFQDGVRINEAFGDIVNWDVLPESAIDRIEVIPGSNPLFGLNTLGGAIAITTRSGRDYPGGSVEAEGGSFGRRGVKVEQGGQHGKLDYFVTAHDEADDGWAEHNPSRVRQFFGKTGYKDARTTLDLSLTAADNDLQGAQTLPRSYLANPRQPYTYPDDTVNRVAMLTLSGKHTLGEGVRLSGTAYYRHFHTQNIDSNVNGNFGEADPVTGAVDATEGSKVESVIAEDSYGLAGQLNVNGKLAGRDNQFLVGVSGDFANADFTQAVQDAAFSTDRNTIGAGPYLQTTHAGTHNGNLSIFMSDTLSLTRELALTPSARYNHASVDIGDRSGTQPRLSGKHSFSRFDPALGLTYNPVPALTAFANYSEGMRTPTAIELACADPAAPCSLPNAFVADPALKPVVSHTFEIGARSGTAAATGWNATLFRTDLDDDIQFISASGASASNGFFQNVGTTRRQGVELGAHLHKGPFRVGASYSFVDATYRSAFVESSPANSSADAQGNITVRRGDRIPGIPRNTFKLRVDYSAAPRWDVGGSVLYRSAIHARGDENNQDVNGKIAGYSVVNFDAAYRVTKQLQVFARVENLCDKRYENVGVLGQNFFNGPGNTFSAANVVNEQFVGVGAPRGAWVGLRYSWE